MKRTSQPLLVAIVGGSGSGKSWLAVRLRALLGHRARCVSLDDFYRDRSHLSPRRRAMLNFDHPRAIDWESVEAVLQKLAAGKPAKVPSYDFKTHCRRSRMKVLRPASVVLVDGLWLLRRPAIRRLFQCRVFIACPDKVRLRRRLNRDTALRARNEESVRRQFRSTVQPMHLRFVEPQKRWADFVLRFNFGSREVHVLAEHLIGQSGRGCLKTPSATRSSRGHEAQTSISVGETRRKSEPRDLGCYF